MKKYLFGLGTMLVGAGLMFVLMHGEVSADSNPEPFVCSDINDAEGLAKFMLNCTSNGITCGVMLDASGISCVNSGGLFK